jgi:hypothetical protein
MSEFLYPFDDTAAVKTYAVLLDRQVGVLAAWKFLLERGFAPEEIMLTLSRQAHAEVRVQMRAEAQVSVPG